VSKNKLNGKEKPGMSNRKPNYYGNSRFIELGSLGAPFRSLINVDHLTNVRFEQKIEEREIRVEGSHGKAAEYDAAGEMTAPPVLPETRMEPLLVGYNINLAFGEAGQTIFIQEEAQAVSVYNTVLDMITGTGVPIARMPKLKMQPKQQSPSGLVGADGAPLDEFTGELTDEELDQLEHPEIDVDAIADAVNDDKGE
jgi:hypothetical protein